jgi:hypothetical protein
MIRHAIVILFSLPLLLGFDSYRVPFERFVRDTKLRSLTFEQIAGMRSAKAYGEHYQITRACLIAAGVKPNYVEQMSRGVSDIDWDNWQNKSHYDAKNHCDRGMGRSSVEAFDSCLSYHRQRIAEAWWTLRENKLADFAVALPRALHAQQDFFSHSNAVDENMAPALSSIMTCWTEYPTFDLQISARANRQQIWDDNTCMAAGPAWAAQLKLTGYDPRARDAYAPPDDKYSHRTFAKDNPRYSPEAEDAAGNGISKYAVALAKARAACDATMQAFRGLCEADGLCRSRYSAVFLERRSSLR